MSDLVERLRERMNDAPMETERLIDDAADRIERLEAVLVQAREALTCTGEHDDPGHRCGHCDDYVDRNGIVRAAIDEALK